nr:MAG TPA: hypothetical protein [Caudoviricetes sp.]DAV08075.1 MAG TPA: hypothetical protein [Caudoviricetes sp.]DAV75874.1 MAG TPA: hypothetical protein [Caudoviricetes sp.]
MCAHNPFKWYLKSNEQFDIHNNQNEILIYINSIKFIYN